METPEKRIAVVVGSTRPTRICLDVATQVCNTLQRHAAEFRTHVSYELLDLAEVDLPMLDEPLMASLGRYEHAHTRHWSAIVDSFDGFVFVFPQYNWGYPAVVKNALDYLYAEWRDKPATVVTYGTRGGSKGAEQLIQVLHGLHMAVLDTHVEIPIGADAVDADWQLIDAGATVAVVGDQIAQVAGEFQVALNS